MQISSKGNQSLENHSIVSKSNYANIHFIGTLPVKFDRNLFIVLEKWSGQKKIKKGL